MFTKMIRTLRCYTALLVLGALMATPASASLINFSATLDCAQANAGAGSCDAGGSGSGTASLVLDDTTNILSWDASWSGLSGSAFAAHLHGPAGPDANASVQVNLSPAGDSSIGNANISLLQSADLLAGLWYLNVHSTAFPGGEIRGQVQREAMPVPATLALFGFGLAGLGWSRRKKT